MQLDEEALTAQRRVSRSSLADVPPRMMMPCLVYIGKAEPEYADALNDSHRMPNARFVTFPRFDHFDTWAHSELVLPHVLAFLGAG